MDVYEVRTDRADLRTLVVGSSSSSSSSSGSSSSSMIITITITIIITTTTIISGNRRRPRRGGPTARTFLPHAPESESPTPSASHSCSYVSPAIHA